ncbi:hypothetical protein WA026_015361 [Henosepilachna vigintioctopunctata]|uniref:Uncharacterized protein n=1 Tax=Henosepilachna vigintioctopunctata TaxID=420089 RepID=A0AAW1UF11_9CUCU
MTKVDLNECTSLFLFVVKLSRGDTVVDSTPLIQAVLINISQDLTPIRNREEDRERFTEKLFARCENTNVVKRREKRDNIYYSPRDFVLMHRDSQMHISKSDHEFLGPYEVVNCLEKGRYDIKNIMTKAAKGQLRLWPTQWSVSCDMNAILQFLEQEDDVEFEKAAKCFYMLEMEEILSERDCK